MKASFERASSIFRSGLEGENGSLDDLFVNFVTLC